MDMDRNQDARSNGRPTDYAFRYEFFSGSFPSPDYIEYVIEIAPDGSGEIRFRRDKEANRPDEYVAIFDPEEEALNHVYRLMMSAGTFEPVWQPPPRRKEQAGGSTARLEVTCGGSCFEVTPARFETLEEMAHSLHEAIRALVPQTTWEKINKFQR